MKPSKFLIMHQFLLFFQCQWWLRIRVFILNLFDRDKNWKFDPILTFYAMHFYFPMNGLFWHRHVNHTHQSRIINKYLLYIFVDSVENMIPKVKQMHIIGDLPGDTPHNSNKVKSSKLIRTLIFSWKYFTHTHTRMILW